MKTFAFLAGVSLILAPGAFSQEVTADSVRSPYATGSTVSLIALGAPTGYSGTGVYADTMGIAIGYLSYAGWFAIALGENSTAAGDYSTAIGGHGNYASGDA